MTRLALALLLASLPLQAQTVSLGLATTNGLATERTHRTRLTSLPGALFLGIGADAGALTGALRVVLSPIQVEQCERIPCPAASAWHWRPRHDGTLVEFPFLIVEPAVGARLTRGLLSIAGGYAAPIAVCQYALCGASPMLVHAAWGEVRGAVGVGALRVGVEAGLTAIPPQHARWTFASEWSGFKASGEVRRDPHTILMYRIGLTLR